MFRIQKPIVAVTFKHSRLQGHRPPYLLIVTTLVMPVAKVEVGVDSMWYTRVSVNEGLGDNTLPKSDEDRG